MTPEQREMILILQDPPAAGDNDWEMLNNVLAGDIALQTSHAGGELKALSELCKDIWKTYVFLSYC